MKLTINQDVLRSELFRGSLTGPQVGGIGAILTAWETATLSTPDLRMVAYTLATAYHETAFTMQPIPEIGAGRGKRYGIPAGPDKQVYYGRGLVQLTWWSNYAKANDKLHRIGALKPDQSLVSEPDLALHPDIAASIMLHGMLEGWFTGRKLGDFFNVRTDWINAREIINGLDRAAAIGGYALHFYHALSGSAAAKQAPPSSPDVTTIFGLQTALRLLGYHVTVDGDYGPETREAVTSFQMHSGIVADGVCGEQTENKLRVALEVQSHVG